MPSYADSSMPPFKGACCDSRQILPGQLFVAIRGAKTDGHNYLSDVAQRGAAAALVSLDYSGSDYGLPFIRTHNTVEALQAIAASHLKKSHCRIIAITGSVGKTTTKEFLAPLLGAFCVSKTPDNANSQIGFPLAVLNVLKGNEELFIAEMGMSYPGELSKLVAIAPPHIAVICNVSLAHAGNFNCLEEIAKAKAELFSRAETQIALFESSIPNSESFYNLPPRIKYSFSCTGDEKADFQLSIGTTQELFLSKRGELVATFPPLPILGRHNAYNFLLASLIAHLSGATWQEITAGQQSITLPERRLELCEKKGVLFVNDAYNACLTSVSAALKSIPIPSAGGRRFFVFGEMLELGAFSETCHLEVGREALDCIDRLYCLGRESLPTFKIWQEAKRPCFYFEELGALIHALRCELVAGDVVLLKGSRSKQIWKVLEEM